MGWVGGYPTSYLDEARRATTTVQAGIVATTSTTTTVYTVTAGKTLWVFHASVGGYTAIASGNSFTGYLIWTDGSDTLQAYLGASINHYLNTTLGSGLNSTEVDYQKPLKIPAGHKIRLVTTNITNASVHAFISGIEE